MALDTHPISAWRFAPDAGILVACALKKESSALGRLLPGLSVATTGCGLTKTARALERLPSTSPPPRLLLFTGTAGGLDPTIRMGEVICPDRWLTEDGRCVQVSPRLADHLRVDGWEIQGAGLTVGRPVVTASRRGRLFRETGARICDMEAAAALAAAGRHGIPAVVIKVISDTGQSSVFAFWRHFHENMRRLAERLAELWPTLEALREKGL